MYVRKNNAAFLNALSEEGSRAEILEWLYRVYDESIEKSREIKRLEYLVADEKAISDMLRKKLDQ